MNKLLYILFIFLVSPIQYSGATPGFNSQRIKELYLCLPGSARKAIDQKVNQNARGNFQVEIKIEGISRNIHYRINKYNELDHVGIYLFIDSVKAVQIKEVYDYIEREFLVSFISGDSSPLIRDVRFRKVEVIYSNNEQIKKGNIFQAPAPGSALKVYYNSEWFQFQWSLPLSGSLRIRIPNDYSLITEKTKDELENELLREMISAPGDKLSLQRPEKENLKPYFLNLFITERESFPNVEELSNEKYFFVRDSVYPVFNNRYVKESVSNLFQNIIPTKLNIEITQILYGGGNKVYQSNINNFLNHFSQFHMLYFGWQNLRRETLKATLIISSKVYNYNHMLEISATSKSFFENKGEIKGTLYAFIPKENKINYKINKF